MEQLPITITASAAKEIKYIIENKNIPEEYALRVGVKGGGGCGGAGFFIGFDKKEEFDKEFIEQDIKIFLDKRHIMYLFDLEVGFEDREDGRGFVFHKPE